jgi:hypothetical protein
MALMALIVTAESAQLTLGMDLIIIRMVYVNVVASMWIM